MRRIVIALVFSAVAPASADAKVYKLHDFSSKEVAARCATVHGQFVSRDDDGSYGCKYAKGVVQCDRDQHCRAILNRTAVHRRKVHPPAQPHEHEYREYRWFPYQQW